MPGVETRHYLLWEGVTSGKISLNRFVEITATAPAKIFGMYPRKGSIAVGADADVVVWDPTREKILGKDTLHMRVDYSPFEGRRVVGGPSHVLSRGELVVENDVWVASRVQGRGQFVRRSTFGL
jgi:dihydropyrimidinase